MAIIPYLAMTAAEYECADPLPPRIAWMACHFSPYSTGLSNLPLSLPEGSVLIVNDITPIHKHEPEMIKQQLCRCILDHKCSAALLDFQRPATDALYTLMQHLQNALPCPAAVSSTIAKDFTDCPVFLPPCPLHSPLAEYIGQWDGREIWLEAALEAETITLTNMGASYSSANLPDEKERSFEDTILHCHYSMEPGENQINFTLWRTWKDMQALLEEADGLGITKSIGLYQELRNCIQNG